MNKNLHNTLKVFMLLVCFSFFQNETNAQTFDNGIFFQALARDNYSNPAKDRKIYVQSTIIQSTITGTKVLVEEFQTTTDASGVFGISIGKGSRTGGSFSSLNNIDWSAGPYFLNLKISITPVAPLESWNYAKDWVDLGTTSFGTVPYSLHAKTVVGFDAKLNATDTAKMLLPYAKSQALTLVQNTVSTKLNTADSVVKYVTPTQLANNKFDTTNLSNRIDLKANAADVIANTASITANTNSIALKVDQSILATVATSGSFNDLTNKPTGYVTSVGSISGSSNAKGAIIASGALSLTPADGTNAGIITTGSQTLAGSKVFSSDINVNGVKVGRGLGNNDQNVAVGADALASGTGTRNTAVGYGAMRQYSGTSFDNNTSVGYYNMLGLTTGAANTSMGGETMFSVGSGNNNTAIGNHTLMGTTSSGNTVLGANAGNTITSGSTNTIIGFEADVASGSGAISNSVAIGRGAQVATSNTVQLGNASVTNVKTNGTITAGAINYPNTAGSSGQVLTTNGSNAASWSAVVGTTNSIWISNSSFEVPPTSTGGVESFYGVFNGYYYKFLSLYNSLSGISQTRAFITPPSSWGNGSYTVTVYFSTSTDNSGTIKLNVGVIPTTMTSNVTTSNEFIGNNAGGFQYGSTNFTHDITAAASNGTWTPRPMQKASFTQNFNFANSDFVAVQLGRYMNQGYSYSDTYPDKVYIVGVKITKN
jgi:hypothetical protein